MPQNLKGRLIVRVKFGLGNRLHAFASAVVAAQELRCALELVWPPDSSDCFGSFVDLFESGFEGVEVKDAVEGRWESAGQISLEEMKTRLGRGERLQLETYSLIGAGLLENEEFARRMRIELRKLKPAAAVRALIESVSQPRVGLHIRFTDHLPCHVFTPRWCYRAALAEVAERRADLAVMICSDTPAFVEELKTESSLTLITPPQLPLDAATSRSRVEGTQAAVASLWLLSRCEVIIAAPTSTFAKTAHQLGTGVLHELAVLSDVRRFKGMELTWHLANLLNYDYSDQRWRRKPGLRGWKRALAGPAAVTAWILGSRLYQDHGPHILQYQLRRRIRALFSTHPALDWAVTGGLTVDSQKTIPGISTL